MLGFCHSSEIVLLACRKVRRPAAIRFPLAPLAAFRANSEKGISARRTGHRRPSKGGEGKPVTGPRQIRFERSVVAEFLDFVVCQIGRRVMFDPNTI